MKAAVQRIFIFGLTTYAHAKRRHGSVRAVVRYVADDAITWSAIGAVGKGIFEAAVIGRSDIGGSFLTRLNGAQRNLHRGAELVATLDRSIGAAAPVLAAFGSGK